VKKHVEAEALISYSVAYGKPLDGYWTRMFVRIKLRRLLAEFEPEEAFELQQALTNTVESTMLFFNSGLGHDQPQARNLFCSVIKVTLNWLPGQLATSDRHDHIDLLRQCVRQCLNDFEPSDDELEIEEPLLHVVSAAL